MANDEGQPPTSTSPVMCSLTPAALKAGREMLLPGLVERAEQVDLTDEGCRLTFPATSDTLLLIARVIDAERQCCRWLQFDLRVNADGGLLELTLRGPAGARPFLAALFDAEGGN